MAIVFKAKNGLAALHKLGVPTNRIESLLAVGVEFHLVGGVFEFHHPTVDLTQYSVACGLVTLNLLASGKLDTAESTKMRLMLTHTLEVISANHIHAMESSGAGPAIGTLNKLPPLGNAASPEAEAPVAPTPILEKAPATPPAPKKGMWLEFPHNEIHTAPQVELAKADRMYQPVLSTSAGSRYFVVAGSTDLRIAARFIGGKLSVRIEGVGYSKHRQKIGEAGLDTNPTYASIHLNVGDIHMAHKTLGAILLGLGLPLDTPYPNLGKIAV